jgi:hypothetical protein
LAAVGWPTKLGWTALMSFASNPEDSVRARNSGLRIDDEGSTIAKWSISVTLGFLLMILLGLTFDALNLPIFNSWALFHVSFMFTLDGIDLGLFPHP